jgi:hypothetical protein
MARDEEATFRTLRAYREVIDKHIERHEGRIFNTAGDAVLAEIAFAVEAVRCAMSIQDELRVRNTELVADRQMLFRIGVNVGDVLVEGDDLLGDGVNIVACLEGVAAPGGICISGTTFEQVKNRLSVGFEKLGSQQIKNIPEPIRVFGITAALVAVAPEAGQVKSETVAPVTPRLTLMTGAGIGIVVTIVIASGAFGYWNISPMTRLRPYRCTPIPRSTGATTPATGPRRRVRRSALCRSRRRRDTARRRSFPR